TRISTIVIIVVHAIALLAFGWWLWGLWLASLIGFIMGGVLLCQFNKCTYIVGASLFVVGAIFDLTSMAAWIAISQSLDDDYNSDWSEGVGWFALPSALGALSFIVGAVFAFRAICNWDKSGAPDAMGPGMPGGPQVVSNAPNVQVAKHEPQAVHHVGSGAPPPYTGNV
ncbi:unnamed protein product, partial [Scytosiphon promiscuus]